MITSQIHQYNEGIDIAISEDDLDFKQTSLKASSIIRITRLMVISEDVMIGKIGSISKERFEKIISNITSWLSKHVG